MEADQGKNEPVERNVDSALEPARSPDRGKMQTCRWLACVNSLIFAGLLLAVAIIMAAVSRNRYVEYSSIRTEIKGVCYGRYESAPP